MRTAVAEAREAADAGLFLEAIIRLEEVIAGFKTNERAQYLAEALMTRSLILDEALIWGQAQAMRAYAEHKSSVSPESFAFESAGSTNRTSLERRIVALHSAVGYLNAIPIYQAAGDQQDRDAAETRFEFALARAQSTDTCGDEKSFEREFRRLFADMGGQRLWTGHSSLDKENVLAVDCWNMTARNSAMSATAWRQTLAENVGSVLAKARGPRPRREAGRSPEKTVTTRQSAPVPVRKLGSVNQVGAVKELAPAPPPAVDGETLAERFMLARESARRNPTYVVVPLLLVAVVVVVLAVVLTR